MVLRTVKTNTQPQYHLRKRAIVEKDSRDNVSAKRTIEMLINLMLMDEN